MTALLGGLLLLAPALYAAAWAWLRGGLGSASTRCVQNVPNQVPSGTRCVQNVPNQVPHAADGVQNIANQVPRDADGVQNVLNQVPRDIDGVQNVLNQVPHDAKHIQNDAEEDLAVGEYDRSRAKATARGEVAAAGLLFSVVVAARNEAATLPLLLHALAAQTLPVACFEVLIADDQSTDGTAALVAAEEAPFALRLIALPPGPSGKKAALTAAIAQARAPWVVCTDADCRPGPGWLAAYAELTYSLTSLHFISGPVRLTPGGAWFDGLLGLEFAGLVGVGGACIGRGRPTMCNGANLAFRRATFYEVGGYADHAGLASGDDEFLLHKMHQRHPAGSRFVAEARAVVDTPAPATLRALLRQRVRWASKWPHYRTAAPRQLAVLVLGANVSLFVGLMAAPLWPGLGPWVAAGWALKLGADAWLLGPMLRLLRRRQWLGWLLPLQLLYAPYALAVGLAGQRRAGYQWKGRQVR